MNQQHDLYPSRRVIIQENLAKIVILGHSTGADRGFPTGGAPRYDFAKFSEKLHEIEKIFGRRRDAPPLDPPLQYQNFCLRFQFFIAQ